MRRAGLKRAAPLLRRGTPAEAAGRINKDSLGALKVTKNDVTAALVSEAHSGAVENFAALRAVLSEFELLPWLAGDGGNLKGGKS